MSEKIEGFYLNGTEYEIGGVEYNAGQGISIGDVSMNARKGPSPVGFHVPAITEWEGLKTIMDGLSLTTGDSWRINLHIPFAGERDRGDGVDYQGEDGYYWSSSCYLPADSTSPRRIHLGSSSVGVGSLTPTSSCCPIRCFKDSYVIPNSGWTVVQGTLGSAGIFWNQSGGLISVTDGTTGYTMMDKNLGATTVYNDGDTLTQANMGNMYQWGNNYGFPSTGRVSKTSSTQVDASAYGPTNPYSSDAFYEGDSQAPSWDIGNNKDLWGDITGTITQENVISNTGVLSVNGQTGDVTIASPDVSNYLAKNNTTSFTPTGDYNPATKKYVDDNAGGSYTAGTGIDITNDEIGLDGTYERDSGGKDYSAMQGPAPSGFHVPLATEWEGLKTIMDGLGLATGDNWRINLHMPFAGIRSWSSAEIGSQGSNGRYWMSSPNKSSINHNDARYLWISSSSVGANYSDPRTQGQSVRCFKNSFELPTSSWTVINGTLGGAGIFWDTTNGLISITSDGTTGYTIQDKNLGATTVYNDGDTLTEANCGKYYQWGNNYGFPFTGSITTSTTQVDTTGYGPGNYYSSSTFITRSGDFRDWSSVRNDNLRGGETGVQPIMISGNLVIGDKLYKIVTSTTAPASGTASNIITIVTD